MGLALVAELAETVPDGFSGLVGRMGKDTVRVTIIVWYVVFGFVFEMRGMMRRRMSNHGGGCDY